MSPELVAAHTCRDYVPDHTKSSVRRIMAVRSPDRGWSV